MKTFIEVNLIKAEPTIQVDGEFYNYDMDYPKSDDTVDGYFVFTPGCLIGFVPKDIFDKNHVELIHNPDLKSDKPSISQQMVDDFIEKVEVLHDPCLDRTTVVKATLKNGFIIVESSSCVSAENYDEEIGKEICMNAIKDKVWAYLGFLLATACDN